MKTATVLVEGVEDAGIVTTVLLDRSAWFEVTPIPGDLYEIKFKSGENHEQALSSLNVTFWGQA